MNYFLKNIVKPYLKLFSNKSSKAVTAKSPITVFLRWSLIAPLLLCSHNLMAAKFTMTPYTGGGTPAVMTTADDGTTTLTATRSDGANFAGVSSGFLDPGVMGGMVAYTVTFNVPITVSSLQIGEFTNNSTSNHYVMTPNVGTPWSIADNDGAIVGAIATHTPSDWVGVTSITYAYSVNNWRVGIDNLVFTVSAPPSITSANYDASTGILAVTAPSMTTGDTIDVSKLTLTGRNDATYTLTSSNVTASSSSTFSVTLNAADKLAINGLLNQNGFDAINGSVYNLAAAANWNVTKSAPADLTGNGITVSNVTAPNITSATYNSSTNMLVVIGTNMVGILGAANDISVNQLTVTAEGGATYTLTSADVEVTSATSFSVILNATDYAYIETILNKNGTSSTSGTTYNLAAADDWNSEITGGNIADASNGVTVSNVPAPSISSATYDGNTGTLVVTGSGFLSKTGGLNDVDISKFTLSGDGSSYSLTSSNVEITDGSSFSVTLNSTDRTELISRLNNNGTISNGAVVYNIAAADDWNAGADPLLNIADLISNPITVSNAATVADAPTIGSAISGDGQASVSFSAPVNNGGAAITAYTVTSSPGGFTATGAASPLTVTGLTNGTAYSFSVTATNAVGVSAASAGSNSVTPQAAQVITFANPGVQNFGTTPTLTATASSGLTPVFTSSTTSVCTITSGGLLSFATTGTCTINANEAGNSAYQAAPQVSQSFSVNAVVTGAPIMGAATAGDAQASVSFSAPASNGGSAITSYTVTSSPGGLTASGAASPLTVTGLTNGTTYTFSATATNAAGTSAASAASNSVTPVAPNSAPTISGSPAVTVAQDTAYSFVPTATDVDAETTLTFSIVNKPSWASFNTTTGALTGTPTNDDIGVTNAIVISVTDGSLSAALPAFNLSVTNTNDAPTISGTPANSVNEGEAYHFAPEANDVDPETTLTFSIVNKPEWLSFDTSNGGLSGTPTNEDVGATAGIVISVSDGELSASLAAFTLNVVNVNDAPNANDDSYSLPIAADSIYILDVLLNDTDPDEDVLRITAASSSVGQVSIVDNSLRFAPADNFNGQASLEYRISDGELSAMARVEVTISGVNPLAPTITIAQDIDVNASGMFTKVNLGAVSARDAQGNRLAVTLLNGQPLFAPGKHQAYWQATDANGISSTETQVVNVHPLVSLSKSQQVNANSAVTVKVLLNGAAPQYPLDINYSVSGSAMAMTDHDLAGGTVQITSGNSADIQFNVFADLASEQSKDIVITLDESLNLGTNASTRITVSNANIAPEVKLQAAQNGVISSQLSKTAGPVTVSGVVSDVNASDALSLTWHAETLINTATDPAQFVFDPAALAAGVYKLTLTATDSGSPALSTTRTINLLLVNSLPVLGDGDSNGNLIPDAEEGYGDRDGNGIPDYQDPGLSCNALPEQLQQVSSYLAEAEPGVCMLKGATSLLTNTGGIELGSDIVPLLEPDMQATNTGGIFDFELSQLPQAGDSIRIVIPQRQPVPAGGIYRKYTTAAGWANFVTNANNSLFSASGNAGYCPPPGDASWQAGLTEGHWCVQLLIEDGGPNDADGIANNSIADPGGVAVPFSNNAIPLATADTYNLQWNQSHELNVLSNDSDADNDSLQITQVSANFGQVSISDDMTQLIYTPETDFIGSDTLVYGISDGKGGTSSAQVAIVVYFNRAPQVVATATASTNDRTAINIDVLSSASDPDGDSLSILVATAEQGMISISEGMLRYVPKAGFDGTDRVSFVISDGRGGIAQGEVLVSVQAYEVITVVNKSSGGSTGVWGLMLLSLLLLRRLKLNAAVRFTRFTKGAAAMLMVLLSSVLLVSTPTAQAKGLTFDGYIGQSTASKSASDIAAGLPAEARLLDYDNSATSFALGGSYSLTDKLALQAHYVDLGETSFSIEADTLSAEQLHQQISAIDSLLAKGIRSGFSYKVLQVEGWSMAVQGGVFSWWSNSSSQRNNTTINSSTSDTDLYWGAAAGYAVSEPVTVQLQYTRYNLSGSKANSVMLGFSYMF